MAAYRRVYDLRHLQADCQKPRSAPEPYARQSSMGYLFTFFYTHVALGRLPFVSRYFYQMCGYSQPPPLGGEINGLGLMSGLVPNLPLKGMSGLPLR